MNQTIKLTTRQAKPIVKHAFPEYTGRKFKIEFAERVTLYDTNWGGGTRNEYKFVSSDGQVVTPHIPAPWVNAIEEAVVEIPANMLVVKHCIFCGTDLGITIYAHPCHLPKWIEAPKP